MSSFVMVHTFMHSSLLVPAWICPRMPWALHSTPWRSSLTDSSRRSSIINPIRTCVSQVIPGVRVNIPVRRGSDIACCHLHGRRVRWVGVGECYRSEAAPPVCAEGWARPRQECVGLRASHAKTAIVKLGSALARRCNLLALSLTEREKMKSMQCCNLRCWHKNTQYCIFTARL